MPRRWLRPTRPPLPPLQQTRRETKVHRRRVHEDPAEKGHVQGPLERKNEEQIRQGMGNPSAMYKYLARHSCLGFSPNVLFFVFSLSCLFFLCLASHYLRRRFLLLQNLTPLVAHDASLAALCSSHAPSSALMLPLAAAAVVASACVGSALALWSTNVQRVQVQFVLVMQSNRQGTAS